MIISGFFDRRTNFKVCVGYFRHNLSTSDGSAHRLYVSIGNENMAIHRMQSKDTYDVNVTDDVNGTFYWMSQYSNARKEVYKHAIAAHIQGQLKLKIESSGSNNSSFKGVMKDTFKQVTIKIGKSGGGMTVELLPNHTIQCTMKDKHGSCGSNGKPSNGTTSSQIYITQAFLQGKYQLFVKKHDYVMDADLFRCNRRSKSFAAFLLFDNQF